MYESYWLLDSKPFENTPDPAFMFNSAKHEEALMRMIYAVQERKEGALITGNYGSGKTILSRALLRELAPNEQYRTVLILNPKITHDEFLKEVLFQLGVEGPSNDHLALQHQMASTLTRIADEGKTTVIIVDEAQVLEVNDFTDLRLLLNFQRSDRFLFTLVLIGQTDLRKKVFGIEPLKQRLAMRYHLTELDQTETIKYIEHRLSVAGRVEPIFTPEALRMIHLGSEGVPRRINNICDHCLLIGFGQRAELIGTNITSDALKDLDEWREGEMDIKEDRVLLPCNEPKTRAIHPSQEDIPQEVGAPMPISVETLQNLRWPKWYE